MEHRGNSEEKEIQACALCKGPFEFWGTSRGFTLYRCKSCQLVHVVEMGQLASFGPKAAGAAGSEKVRAERSNKALQGHKITFQDAGEPPVHAFIGTGGEDGSPDSETLDADPDVKKSDLEREKEAIPFSGYQKYV
ncbi:MAG: hypothetical protein V3V56_03300 [bacterium]